MEQATKNAIISQAILAKIQSGMCIQEAFDAVLGEGAYMKLAGELYDELKVKQ